MKAAFNKHTVLRNSGLITLTTVAGLLAWEFYGHDASRFSELKSGLRVEMSQAESRLQNDSKSGEGYALKFLMTQDAQVTTRSSVREPAQASINLRVLGLFIGERAKQSHILVVDSTGTNTTYATGDTLPDGHSIVEIANSYLILAKYGFQRRFAFALAGTAEGESVNRLPEGISTGKEASESKETVAANESQRSEQKNKAADKGGTDEPDVQVSFNEVEQALSAEQLSELMSSPINLVRHIKLTPSRQGIALKRGGDGILFDLLGLDEGDIVRGINGVEATNISQMMSAIRKLNINDGFTIKLNSNGKRKTVRME